MTTLKVGVAISDDGDIAATEDSVAYYRHWKYLPILVSGRAEEEMAQRYGHLNVPLYSVASFIPFDEARGHGHLQHAWQTAFGKRWGGAAWLFANLEVDVAIACSNLVRADLTAEQFGKILGDRPDKAALVWTTPPHVGELADIYHDASLIIGRGAFDAAQQQMPRAAAKLAALNPDYGAGETTVYGLLKHSLKVSDVLETSFLLRRASKESDVLATSFEKEFEPGGSYAPIFHFTEAPAAVPEQPGVVENYRSPDIRRALNPRKTIPAHA